MTSKVPGTRTSSLLDLTLPIAASPPGSKQPAQSRPTAAQEHVLASTSTEAALKNIKDQPQAHSQPVKTIRKSIETQPVKPQPLSKDGSIQSGSSKSKHLETMTQKTLPPGDASEAATRQLSASAAPGTAPVAGKFEAQKLGDGVFIGEGVAKSGEKIYLRMEKIDKETRKILNQYVTHSRTINNSDTSLVKYLALKTRVEKIDGKPPRYVFEDFDSYKEELGYEDNNDPEFQKLLKTLAGSGYLTLDSDDAAGRNKSASKRHILTQAIAGFGHIQMHNDGCYIVYAAKTPEFSLQSLASSGDISKRITLKEYVHRYDKLLMCVGSDFSDHQESGSYYSRGISRNPINTIENTHRGISMVMHGFTGSVARKYFTGIEEMKVEPVAIMGNLILMTLDPQDVTVLGLSTQKALKLSKIPDHELPLFRVKIDALDNHYKNHGDKHAPGKNAT
jgi:hypothetical protein